MATNEFSASAEAMRIIRQEGYSPDTSMQSHIADWQAIYERSDPFYKVAYLNAAGKRRTRDRASLSPARKVCREMASLILTEDTSVSVDKPMANEWLQGYLAASNFWPTGYKAVERAFRLGTCGWALGFDFSGDGCRITLPLHDARMVVPLSWSSIGISECAFVSRVVSRGKPAEQVQIMARGEGGTYRIKTWLLREGRALDPEQEGIIADFDTQSRFKPFGIFTPGFDNIYDDLSPYGASLFADAVDEMRAVDIAWDAFMQEVRNTGMKMFVDEEMVDMNDDGDGNIVPTGVAEDTFYRKVEGKEMKNYLEVFSPDIRTDPLLKALDAALAEMGDQCGFGQNYFTLQKTGAARTAKEVVSDNSQLMRNVRKHEAVVRGAIQDVVSALLDNARIHCGAAIEEDFGAVRVEFDDSVIVDTQTEKELMLAEIAAGVVPKWMYLQKFHNMSEEEARAALPQETVIDTGF